MKNILSVRNLSTHYETSIGDNEVLSNFCMDIAPGEMLGLIGESGCGKSTAGLSFIRMIKAPGRICEGEIILDGKDISKIEGDELRSILWKQISMIPQSAMNALNPSYRVGDQILEAVRLHLKHFSKEQAVKHVKNLLVAVGMDEKWYDEYPHKLSGGMKQRVIIAMALSCKPKVIISDESTSGLDVLIEAQILALFKRMKLELGISVIIISHDLRMVTSICDRIGIMYAGHLVELGTSKDISENPTHPYTKALFDSQVDVTDFSKKVTSIEGTVPELINPECKCRFYSRCTRRSELCDKSDAPKLKSISDTHQVACYMEA